MKCLLIVTFLGLAVTAVFGSKIPQPALFNSPRSDVSLANFLLARNVQLRAGDAASSAQCFGIYLPLLTQVADQWQEDYQNCVNVASNNRSEVLEQKREEQQEMSADASNVCSYITTCQAINSTLDFFNCFSLLGQHTLNPIYTISNNASDLASDLVEQVNLIDVDMYKCTNASERAYVENTSNIYEALDACLQYGPPPTVPPSTSTSAPAAPASVVNPVDIPAQQQPASARSLAETVQAWLKEHDKSAVEQTSSS